MIKTLHGKRNSSEESGYAVKTEITKPSLSFIILRFRIQNALTIAQKEDFTCTFYALCSACMLLQSEGRKQEQFSLPWLPLP
jgi:hypothetical protein